jgi:hypothetical protein
VLAAPTSAQPVPGPVPALRGVPQFRADPNWPTLPADFRWGQVIGIFADRRGHVWTSTQSRIQEWDPQGKLVQSWDARGPNGNWSTIHGMFVDHNDFVWTNARESNLTVKFSKTGQVVMTIGRYNESGGSNDTTLMGRPSEIWVDPADNEVFVADGYGNRRRGNTSATGARTATVPRIPPDAAAAAVVDAPEATARGAAGAAVDAAAQSIRLDAAGARADAPVVDRRARHSLPGAAAPPLRTRRRPRQNRRGSFPFPMGSSARATDSFTWPTARTIAFRSFGRTASS